LNLTFPFNTNLPPNLTFVNVAVPLTVVVPFTVTPLVVNVDPLLTVKSPPITKSVNVSVALFFLSSFFFDLYSNLFDFIFFFPFISYIFTLKFVIGIY
jgi:hypothetical protein